MTNEQQSTGIDPESLGALGLQFQISDAVATITLNRPEVRNAQTPAMWRALAAIGAHLTGPDNSTPDVRIVVIHGAGQSFSAGLDRAMLDPRAVGGQAETVVGLLAGTDQQLIDTIGEYQAGFSWLRDPRFISIALVQGHAIGAGFQLALACDLRILADDAQLSMKEAALGLVPDLTGTQPLVECVGYARALEICATARVVGAAEAQAIGLATAVVPLGGLEAAADQLIGALTGPPAGAVREIKALLQDAGSRPPDQQRLLERTAQARRFRALAAPPSG